VLKKACKFIVNISFEPILKISTLVK